MSDEKPTMPTDEELLRLAKTDFDGQCPVPQVDEKPYYLHFYRMGYAMLARIKAAESRSLRDEFAAHAPEIPDWFEPTSRKGEPTVGDDGYYEWLFFTWRWHFANAMLAEREKKT